jgi:hypothetical protein
MRRAKADRFESRKLYRKTFAVSEGCAAKIGKTGHVLVRTSACKSPVISVVGIGYARRPEIMHSSVNYYILERFQMFYAGFRKNRWALSSPFTR